jgi:hypothetical protein
MANRKPNYRTKKSYRESFQIKLGRPLSVFTIPQLREMMMLAADQLEAGGITHVKPCNLYINPVDARGEPIVRVLGEPLADVLIPEPYRSAADEHGL